MPSSRGMPADRRPRGQEPRDHVVKVKLSAAERASLSAAAERVGMALAAYIGQAAMDAAEHRAVPVSELQRQMLTELIRVGRPGPPRRREPQPGCGQAERHRSARR